MTNGEKIKEIFPSTDSRLDEKTGITTVKWADNTTKFFKTNWWNAEYKKPNKTEIPTGSTTKNDLGVDAILRKQAIDAFPDLLPNMGYNKKAITEILQKVPPVQPKIGHWINIDETHSKCDRCGAVFEIASENGEVNYCPDCGAKMIDPWESEGKEWHL